MRDAGVCARDANRKYSAIGGIIAAPRDDLVYSKSLLSFMVATANDVVNGVGVQVWYGHAQNPVHGL
jgi:hypothetical protein